MPESSTPTAMTARIRPRTIEFAGEVSAKLVGFRPPHAQHRDQVSERGPVYDTHDAVHYALTRVHASQRLADPIFNGKIPQRQNDFNDEQQN
jgi:hypothetical protein